jgi:hypothetical protein
MGTFLDTSGYMGLESVNVVSSLIICVRLGNIFNDSTSYYLLKSCTYRGIVTVEMNFNSENVMGIDLVPKICFEKYSYIRQAQTPLKIQKETVTVLDIIIDHVLLTSL